MKKWIISLSLVAALCISCQETTQVTNEIKRGNFKQSVTETGELVTADTKLLVMPRFGRYWYSFSIIGMLEHGSLVEAGDSLIQLDPTEVKQFIVDRETRLENQEAVLQKLIVNNNIEMRTLDANLRSQEAAFNLSKLQLASAEFDTERGRKVKELQFKQAEIRYEKVKRNIEYSKVISKNEEIIQRLQMEQLKSDVEMARAVLPKLTIRTPISGIFQVGKRRRDFIKVGDEVRVGNQLGSVPDLTWMKVNTIVSEVDRRKINKGDRVLVRMDALPNEVFEGEIEYIGILCREYSYSDPRKVFDVLVKIDKTDERLKPGMTVSCEFVADDLNDVLYVPNDCVLRENGHYYVYLSSLVGSHKTPVEVVTRNNIYTVVRGEDLREGQNVTPVDDIKE